MRIYAATVHVKSAWDDIPADIVKKSFLKTGIANALDGSGDDQLWDDSSDDEGDQVEESLPLSRDADEDAPKEDWDKLFEDSECSDFDGF